MPVALLAAVEAALNRYLAMDPESSQRMAALEGRVIAIELSGLGLCFFLLPGDQGVQVLGTYEGEPDTRLRGTPLAMMRLASGPGAAKLLFGGDVQITGDTELGQRFKQILDELDIDWEEHLSRLTGDVLAHQLVRGLRTAQGWGRETADSLRMDLAEYLQEESRVLVTPIEAENFMADIDTLRADVDRLEARIKRLQEARDQA